ncbi:MAG: hypothetical protein LBM99_02035 [Bacillales bacterium]|jgi:predicted O-methyltransferase YrrM|nr:hypothetical protein [Bacillales bacterium]
MNYLNELKEYAKEHYVPIARLDVVEYLDTLIKKNKYQTFLEIGTAIAYTSIYLALQNKISIVTVERDLQMFKTAKDFINKYQALNILQIYEAASYFYPENKYDLIFIDANKSHNLLYLQRYLKCLTSQGTIVIDNINLNDLLGDVPIKKKQKYEMINQTLIENIQKIPNIEYQIKREIGDGIAIIKQSF